MNVTPPQKAQPLPIRKVLTILACVLLPAIAGIAVWKNISDPPKPWLVRWRVARYLKKQSGQSDFKIEFPFPSAAQMAIALPKQPDGAEILLKGKLTGKEFDTLKSEYITLESSALALERKIAAGKVKLEPD